MICFASKLQCATTASGSTLAMQVSLSVSVNINFLLQFQGKRKKTYLKKPLEMFPDSAKTYPACSPSQGYVQKSAGTIIFTAHHFPTRTFPSPENRLFYIPPCCRKRCLRGRPTRRRAAVLRQTFSQPYYPRFVPWGLMASHPAHTQAVVVRSRTPFTMSALVSLFSSARDAIKNLSSSSSSSSADVQ